MSVLAALWGASYMFIKVALDDVSPFVVVWVRLVLAALVLLPIAHRRGALAELRPHASTILFLSIIQVAAPFLLITFGEKHIASALAGILVASAPIFTALLAFRIDREELATGWALVGIGIGILGVVLLFGVDLTGDSAALIGGLMVLLASLGYAIGPFEMKRKLQGVQPVGIAAATMTLAALLLTPVIPFVWPTPCARASTRSRSLLVLGAGGTGVAFLIFYTLIAEVGPGPRDGRRLHRAGVQRRLRRGAARRELHRGHRGRPAADPRGSWLAAGGRISRSGLSRSSVPAPARAR